MAVQRQAQSDESGTAVDAATESGATAPGATVAERIRRIQGALSPGERKIARALMARYPAAGLESTSGLASRAGVSPPTVVRFVARLGFDGYRQFQQSLRDEVQARRASPLTLTPLINDASSGSDIAAATEQVGRAALSQTFAALPDQEFDRAVNLVCDPAKRICSFGGRFSHLLAQYLDLHLRLLRPGTVVHQQGPRRDAGFLVDLGQRDVCVVFDFRRYQRDTVELARFAHGRKARIVLVTDPWLSPIAEFADVVLPTRVESPSPFDSILAPTALVEALVAAVHARLGASAAERMTAADAAWDDFTTE
ncbi:MurR/RpiR family transcriptional regulator [Streptomyces sp. NPDC005393]|uniref:MurR/RpiR family transcriptional regulator n=1 Tax=Streptomyces sp. NPDC005393 TaxID=3157041 RepID=UPI0033A7D1E4